MSFSIKCPNCTTRLKVPAKSLEESCRCPGCKSVINIRRSEVPVKIRVKESNDKSHHQGAAQPLQSSTNILDLANKRIVGRTLGWLVVLFGVTFVAMSAPSEYLTYEHFHGGGRLFYEHKHGLGMLKFRGDISRYSIVGISGIDPVRNNWTRGTIGYVTRVEREVPFPYLWRGVSVFLLVSFALFGVLWCIVAYYSESGTSWKRALWATTGLTLYLLFVAGWELSFYGPNLTQTEFEGKPLRAWAADLYNFKSPKVRLRAIDTLARAGKRAVPVLREVLKGLPAIDKPKIRVLCLEANFGAQTALGRIGPDAIDAVPDLIANSPFILEGTLLKIGDDAIPPLTSALEQNEMESFRKLQIIKILAKMSPKGKAIALSALEKAMNNIDYDSVQGKETLGKLKRNSKKEPVK